MAKLNILDLSSNQLKGYFPENLSKLTTIYNGQFKCGENCLKLAPNASLELIDWLNAKSTDWQNQLEWHEDVFGCWSNGLWQRKTDPLTWKQFSKQQVKKVLIANIDGVKGDELSAHFTAANEIWIYYANGSWQKQLINSNTLMDFTMGDINGDGKYDFIGSWSDIGLWCRDSEIQTWSQLSKKIPEKLVAGDLDTDGKDDFLAIFPTEIWIRYSGNGSWAKQAINRIDLITLTVGDLNGDNITDLIGSWTYGVWWRNGATHAWSKLSAQTPDVITAGDIDGDGKDDVIGNFGSIGVWAHKSTTNSWEQLSKNSATCLATGRVD
jgi:hypothetical protein